MMYSSPNRLVLIFAALTLLMGGVALYFGVQLGQARAALNITRQQVLERDRMLFRQERARQHTVTDVAPADGNDLPDTVKVEAPAAAVFADELGTLTGEQLSNLMKAGLPADPEAFLRADLLKNPETKTLFGERVTDVRILSEHAALVAYYAPNTDLPNANATSFMQYRILGPGRVEWRQITLDIDAVDDWK